ncbi:MAG: hypothetical protein E6551_13155 [Lachnospiraceae bacterium]|nr:hypothetical protein [Lachnospiraceae bacterium]
MENVRIAILSTGNAPLAYMDNKHKKSMHYWKDELHEFLQGAANTYTFTVNSKHTDAQHITVGNKVAFKCKGKSYYLNIVNTEQTEETITATAWSLSFELINEDAGEYKAGKAMSFEEYLAVFDAERTLKLGLNEVSDKRITNEWTGTTTVLKRLFSLANVFSAEIEFETVLNSDYSLKEIVLNVYREHSDTDSGIGEYRGDVVLRYGKGITGIRKTTDAEKLYTCIQPTGKDGLTINGLDKKEYDENGNIEYFTDGALIRAPQARDRFPSNIVNKADAYILMRKEYDTDSKDKLYSMALSDLKTASEPVVTYEVDGYFDTNIGDTVRIQDQEWTPVLYLQARVSEQVRSLTDPKTAKTVFSNYKELASEISDDLIKRMQDLINKNKVYTCSIATNNGIIFKNGIGSTTLTAYAYNNGVDVSGNLEIRWSKDGTEFYVGRSVTVNAEDVDVKAVYSFTALENGVRRGYYEVTITNVEDGKDGEDGIAGVSYYTWLKYADDEKGNGMSDSPDGKQYMGIAYNKESPDESLKPADYQWSRITGEGIPGKPGADGKTYYTWVRYADDENGTGMSDDPSGKYYIGLAFNKESQTESSNPKDYQWSKYRGDDGIPGTDGEDGRTSYFHVKYSAVSNPSSSAQMTETPSKYIGTYVDYTQQDSNNPKDYTWSQFQGDPGENGIPGENGEDGRTSYLHIAYANSADGWTDFSTTASAGKQYMGQYVDFTERDSTNPDMYKWTKVKGENGQDGQDGQDGTDGQDGVGIKSITKYYLASEKSTGITISSSGWSTTKQDMTDVKKYLWSYEVYAYTDGSSTKTTPIIIGVHGQNGADGDSGIIVSPTAPENPKAGQLWQTASGEPIKRWDGSRWVIHYIAVENLDVQTLSAIVANLGTVTAGLIKSKGGHFYINVDTGEIVSKSSDGTISVFVKKENIDMVRSFTASRYWGSRLNYSGLEFYSGGSSMADDIANGSIVCSIRGDEEMRDFSVTNINGDSIWLIRTIKQLAKSISYDSGTVKGPYTSTNPSNNIRVELKRRGCVVTCKITALIQFPETYSELVGTSVIGTGRYYITKDGGVSIVTGKTDYCERIKTFTWITDDE